MITIITIMTYVWTLSIDTNFDGNSLCYIKQFKFTLNKTKRS